MNVSPIRRGESPLAQHQFQIGKAKVAFFNCGEFTGSRTANNGPFWTDRAGRQHYLENPTRQLPHCNILVDLAHQTISASIAGVGNTNPRWVHWQQMKRFSKKGIAVLTHHHAGKQVNGRPHFKHQSNLVIFRGGTRLPASAVAELL